MSTSVLIADDQRLFAEAARTMLEQEPGIVVLGIAENGAKTLEMVSELQPDVLLLDIELPDMAGQDVISGLAGNGSAVRVVALSRQVDGPAVQAALNAGAAACVPKSSSSGSELVRAITTATLADGCLCPVLTEAVAEVDAGSSPSRIVEASILGARECEVLQRVATGMRSPAIALDMNISVSTVEVHRRNIMRKLDLHSVAELTKYAIRNGLTAL